jgi:2-polyprenyl-3-methyl-5-hydroxy-6-metoxy-1,4-benzoquinol methylase
MSLDTTTYKEYLFGVADDGERRTIQHSIFRPDYISQIEKVLDEYGLATRLEEALKTGKKLRFLDLGCAEGMFLHDLAEVLERRGLLAAAELNGIDRDEATIELAEQFALASNPPRPYLTFYTYDLTQPLTGCRGLSRKGEARFDFISGISFMAHLSNSRNHLENFYQALKPGGVIFLRDTVLEEGGKGWISSHPVLIPFGYALNNFLRNLNNGLDISVEQARWLEELGAEKVEETHRAYPVGGTTQLGMRMLRNTVMLVRNSGASLTASKMLTQAQFDHMIDTLFRELGPDSRGQQSWIEVIARKP